MVYVIVGNYITGEVLDKTIHFCNDARSVRVEDCIDAFCKLLGYSSCVWATYNSNNARNRLDFAEYMIYYRDKKDDIA